MQISLDAKHGKPEVWICDERARAVSIFRDPAETTYRTLLTRGQDEKIGLPLLVDVRTSLADL